MSFSELVTSSNVPRENMLTSHMRRVISNRASTKFSISYGKFIETFVSKYSRTHNNNITHVL